MEKKIMGLWAFFLVVLALVSANTVAGITCQEAVATLSPCQPFLQGTVPSPGVPCCMAVDSVNKQATTKQIRQELCECFKKVGPAMGVRPDRARELPGDCKVDVPVPIDPSVDCSKVN